MNPVRQRKPCFFGENLTDEQCEVLQLDRFGDGTRVFRKHLGREMQLYQTKWFDYRILHPVVATYLYAYELNKTYQRYYQMTRDYEIGQYIKISKGKDIWFAKNSGGFIKGRQQADELGIPYDFYTSAAFNFLYIKKWKNLPRQNHMYAPDLIEHVQDKWVEYSKITLVVAKNDFFKSVGNTNRPEFISHQQWLEDRLSLSKVKSIARESLIERGYFI